MLALHVVALRTKLLAFDFKASLIAVNDRSVVRECSLTCYFELD